MYVEAIESEISEFDRSEAEIHGHLPNGREVNILTEDEAALSICFKTNVHKEFSFNARKAIMKPLMSRISDVSVGYSHKNSDGSSDDITVSIHLNEDKDSGRTSSNDNETENQGSDIDSQDRDQDKDN